MNAEFKALLFPLLWRLLPAGALFLLGTAILLAYGPVGGFLGFGLYLIASIILAFPLATLLAAAWGNLFWSISYFDKPQPMYGIPQSRRVKGLPEEALAEYEKILAQFPGEIRPHFDMIEIALLDLRDPAHALYLRALDRLKKPEDKAALETIYSETLTRLDPKPVHPPCDNSPPKSRTEVSNPETIVAH